MGLDHPPHVSRILLHRLLGKLARLRVRLADVPQILVQDEELAVVLADQFPATISLAVIYSKPNRQSIRDVHNEVGAGVIHNQGSQILLGAMHK